MIDVVEPVRNVRHTEAAGVVPARAGLVHPVGERRLPARHVVEILRVVSRSEAVDRGVREAHAARGRGRGLDARPDPHHQRARQAGAALRRRLSVDVDEVAVAEDVARQRRDVRDTAAGDHPRVRRPVRLRQTRHAHVLDGLLVGGLLDEEARAAAGERPRRFRLAHAVLVGVGRDHGSTDADGVLARGGVIDHRHRLDRDAVAGAEHRHDDLGTAASGVAGGREQRAAFERRLAKDRLADRLQLIAELRAVGHLRKRSGHGVGRVRFALAEACVHLPRALRVIDPFLEAREDVRVEERLREVEVEARHVRRHPR